MKKEINITLTERKARTLLDCLHTIMHQLDDLYEKNKVPSTKQSADVIEEIYEDIREKLYPL